MLLQNMQLAQQRGTELALADATIKENKEKDSREGSDEGRSPGRASADAARVATGVAIGVGRASAAAAGQCAQLEGSREETSTRVAQVERELAVAEQALARQTRDLAVSC